MRAPDELIVAILNCKEVAMIKQRYRTMHALDEALKVAGWELADILEGKQKIGEV